MPEWPREEGGEGHTEVEVQSDPDENLETYFEKALINQDEATLAVVDDLEAEAEKARFSDELGPISMVNPVQEVPFEEPARQHPRYPNARPPIPRQRAGQQYPEYTPVPSVPETQTIPQVIYEVPQDAKGAFGRVYDRIRQRYENRQRRKEERRGREQDEAFFAELTEDQRLDMQMTLGFSAAAFAVAYRRKPYWMK